MTAVKSARADAFIASPPPACRAILLYGPDAGLVSERSRAAAAAFAGKENAAEALTRIAAEDIRNDPGRIADEAASGSLFGGRRVLAIRPEGQDVSGALAGLKDAIAADILIVVEAGDLRPTSPLRKLFEREEDFAAVPCYADSERDLEVLIDDRFRDAGQALDADARAWLVAQLGGDRIASRMELEKLALYAQGRDRVTLADAVAVIGDVSALELSDALDAAGLGDLPALDRTVHRLLAGGTAPAQIATAAIRHFLMLHLLRAEVDGGKQVRSAVDSARPPIFFRRKDAVARQVQTWPRPRLEAALDRLHEAERLTREGDRLAATGVVHCLLEVCAVARHAS